MEKIDVDICSRFKSLVFLYGKELNHKLIIILIIGYPFYWDIGKAESSNSFL